jgi:hypothetical protein
LNVAVLDVQSAQGFSAGADYHVVITTGTVDSVSVVGEVVGEFTVGGKVDLVDNAVDTSSVATGAIDADALATDAVDEIADGVWDELLSGHTAGGSAGKALNNAAAFIVTDGTCQASGQSSTNVRLAAAKSATDEIYTNDVIVITGGTGQGESALITAYDGTNKDCTVSPALVVTCDGTSTYEILPAHSHAEDLGTLATAAVNAEVLDVVNVDTITLPGQEAPPLAPTHRQALGWLYKVLRNRKEQTTTEWQLMADDESTVDAKATVSDDGSTAIKQEIVTGP